MVSRILKADKIYTSRGEILDRGMIAIDENDRIEEVGKNLSADGVSIEFVEGSLCPGFVNTHCHLELSHLKGKVIAKQGLDRFISSLQAQRNAETANLISAMKRADQKMKEAGIVAVGDICNDELSFAIKKQSELYYYHFIELFAFDPEKAEAAFQKGVELKQKLKQIDEAASLVPHSPYSVSLRLLQKIVQSKGQERLCIHNQETASENELYQSGKGKIAELLKSFGLNLGQFQQSGKNSLPSLIDFFPKDIPLLLVHNTYSSREDIRYAEKTHPNLYWCFCPKANLYIEDQLPNFSLFMEEGVKCTLGTDSLASNDSLSILQELRLIHSAAPEIEREELIQMACINGAEFLGIEAELGSLEKGKKAKINQLIEGDDGFWSEVKVVAS